jgi:predicted nucleic acid-binding protein
LRQCVLDVSVLGRWIFQPREPAAAALRAEFEAGQLIVAVPALIFLELLNVAGRQLGWAADRLSDLVDRLERLRFDVLDPELVGVATWVSRGLTAYDANYVALAEQLQLPLITDDHAVLRLAARIAVPIAKR